MYRNLYSLSMHSDRESLRSPPPKCSGATWSLKDETVVRQKSGESS
ncbi:MAG TPA: hypothetical protein V6C63_12360 [Allocoleopsis sp.]